jgi:four helix bundle protein
MRNFRKYSVWEQSHKFTLLVYEITRTFPSEEKFGITSQLRRACTSIPTNFAEGCGKPSEKDFARFLSISYGSASEVDYLLLLSYELGFLNDEIYQKLNTEIISIRKQLYNLIQKLNG